MGVDKIEKEAVLEGKSAWDIAKFYTDAFKVDLKNLNIIEPKLFAKATDYIADQIELIKTLQDKGFTYQTSDGLYFDTAKIEDYNKLSHLPLESLQEGARVEINSEKKNPTDFALWKFSPRDSKRQMEWESPWGVGFPGWHIECSAIALKYLKDNLDIHCGGIDHINIHHTNEIAQSEAATGIKFFNYWLHNEFINVKGGEKMAKSKGNFLTLDNVFIKAGLDPLAFRYACLNVYYRKPITWGDDILENAVNSLKHLRHQVSDLGMTAGEISLDYKTKFLTALNDDLNSASALALTQEVLKSDLSSADKLATVLDFDKVLGLKLQAEAIPVEIIELAEVRQTARKNNDFAGADALRDKIETAGYSLKDSAGSYVIIKK